MNYIGFKTLLFREIRRFWKVKGQTIGSPIVTSSLFLLIFGYSIGQRIGEINGISYLEFMIPGFIMINVITSAISNSSSSIMLSKITNLLPDILVTPLSYLEIVLAFTFASILRGFLVGGLIYIVSLFFTGFIPIFNIFYVLLVLAIASFLFGILGVIIGIWANTFDQLAIVPTFIVTPLSYLGGVFYSISMLPQVFQKISLFNPFFYMIDSLRYGFYGISDANPIFSVFILVMITAMVSTLTWYIFKTGYKIKN